MTILDSLRRFCEFYTTVFLICFRTDLMRLACCQYGTDYKQDTSIEMTLTAMKLWVSQSPYFNSHASIVFSGTSTVLSDLFEILRNPSWCLRTQRLPPWLKTLFLLHWRFLVFFWLAVCSSKSRGFLVWLDVIVHFARISSWWGTLVLKLALIWLLQSYKSDKLTRRSLNWQ